MPLTQSPERPNHVHITDVGPSRKKLRIEVPRETVDESLGLSLDTLLLEAELPGFRRGRAPKSLIQKKFGGAVRKQAKEQLVATALQKAVEDNKLRVLGNPVADGFEALEVREGHPLAFEVEVEVLPEFELPALEGIAVRKPIIDVTDAMVAAEIEKLRVQEGTLEERQAPEPGDYLTGHAKLTGPDGKVYFESDGIVVQVPPADKQGKGMIVGLAVDDLGPQLGLPSPAQLRTIRTKGPENHENEALRGLDLTVEYTPARVDRIIPAQLEDLLARFGMAQEADLQAAMRQRLEQRVRVEQSAAMRTQVARHLLENVRMDLPERVTAGQAQRNLERRRMELMYRGVDPMKIEENLANLRAASAAEAIRELKLFFILDRAAERLAVRVSDAEVNGRISQMAMERNERPEKLRQELIQSNQVGNVYQQIREHKTMDAILAKAAVTELPADEFNKQMQDEAKAAGTVAR